MNLTELSEEESYVLIEHNPYFNIETTQLLCERTLILYPQLTYDEFNQIYHNLVDYVCVLVCKMGFNFSFCSDSMAQLSKICNINKWL